MGGQRGGLLVWARRRERGGVKVLHRGRAPDRRIRATCSRCKSRVEFLPEEGRSGEQAGDQRSVGLVVVSCPTCGYEVVGRERR